MYKANDKRYQTMKYNKSGDSGLYLPVVSLGFWHNFGKNSDFDNMKNMCFTAFDNGITHFDLANNYGPDPGDAERNLGKILKQDMSAYRDELIISTKAGYGMWPGPYGDFGSRKYLISSLDQSLKRMDLDYVDIFYHHRPDPDTPLEETMLALADIVRMGKALYVGLSNYDGERLQKATEILDDLKVPFIINQNKYNIFDRTIENNGLLEKSRELKKGIMVFSPLHQGVLTNRYIDGFPADSRVKTYNKFLNEKAVNETIDKVKKLNDFALSRGQSLAQMALQWVLKDDAITSVLIGASKPEQILDNLKVLDAKEFTVEELKAIDEIVL